MVKVQIKSEQITPFGGIFSIMEQFDALLSKNTVNLLMTAFIRNFYKTIIKRMNVKLFGLPTTSRIRTFVFKFISVPTKWIKTSKEYRLNIYTVNPAYAKVFNASD